MTQRLLYNCSEGKKNIPSGVTYIGRGSKWGNPFIIGPDGNRDEVVEKFRQHLKSKILHNEITVTELMELYNKPLLCHCYPLICHGNVLIDASIWAYNKINKNKV